MRPFAYMNDFTLNGEQPVMVPIKLQSLRDIVQYLFTDMNEGEFESDYEFKKLRSLLDEFNLALEKAEFEARQEKTKLAQIDPRLKIIANHYGLGSQLFKLIEESAELIVAITHIHHNDETRQRRKRRHKRGARGRQDSDRSGDVLDLPTREHGTGFRKPD